MRSAEIRHGANTEQVLILCGVTTKVQMKCRIAFLKRMSLLQYLNVALNHSLLLTVHQQHIDTYSSNLPLRISILPS